MTRFLTRPKIRFEFKGEDGFAMYSLKDILAFRHNDDLYVIKPRERHTKDNEAFLFNLASVPKMFQWIHKSDSKQTFYSSILHDYYYSSRVTSRLKDDWLFLVATKSEQNYYLDKIKPKGYKEKVSKIITSLRYFATRWALFLLVRCFGYWNKAR